MSKLRAPCGGGTAIASRIDASRLDAFQDAFKKIWRCLQADVEAGGWSRFLDEAGCAANLRSRVLADTDGCLAGLCEYTVCQPVDMVATRRMLVTTAANKGSIIGDLLAISRESGVVGWIAGVTRASARGSKYAFSGGGGGRGGGSRGGYGARGRGGGWGGGRR